MERKIQLKKGLTINKEAISKLQETQMAIIKGGSGASKQSCYIATCWGSCNQQSCPSR
jgi:natural product precursor